MRIGSRRWAPRRFDDGRPQFLAQSGPCQEPPLLADGFVAPDLPDLLGDLGTLCRNTIRVPAAATTFKQLTTPTPLQAHAFELLGLRPLTRVGGRLVGRFTVVTQTTPIAARLRASPDLYVTFPSVAANRWGNDGVRSMRVRGRPGGPSAR